MVINCNDLKRIGRTPSPPPPLMSKTNELQRPLAQQENTNNNNHSSYNNINSINNNLMRSRRKSSSTSTNSSSATPTTNHGMLLLESATDSVRNNLYLSIEQRGLEAVCLDGATDADIIDFASKVSPSVMKKITSGSLRTSSVTDKGLEIFLAALNQSLHHLQLSGEKKKNHA